MSTIDDNNDQYSGSGEETDTNECTSCEQHNIDTITEGINSIAVLDDISTCAACGKEGNSDDMNICNKCKEVKYCNAACKKKHRSKHKKKCDRRVAELHDEQLFKEHPPSEEECPICMLSLPINVNQSVFKLCCGKIICNGCMYAMKMSEGKDICAFCRTPDANSDEENVKRTKNLVDRGNAEAFNHLAGLYSHGIRGMPQDYQKANELWLKGGELGCAEAYYNLGIVYRRGEGVEIDDKKAIYYYELAAMMGHVSSRHNLACFEGQAGNHQRALRHFILAARAGDKESLYNVKVGFTKEYVTKDEYANTLHAYQQRQDEMKSDERDKAAASGIFPGG